MPGPPQARVADMHSGTCTLGAPLPILPPCCTTVMVCKMPAARATDLCAGVTPVGAPMPPHPLVKCSGTVFIGKLPAARIGDLCTLGGVVATGAPTVLTGG